ncbi:MAG: AMP-binding protein [Deltaproteobacteria bacterium]|nr:AMP-binding protein [Deltaproteobacteria bacterium]
MELYRVLEHSVRLYGDKPAVTSARGSLTYRQFMDAAERLGSALYGLGLKPGDRVAILDHNSIELAVAHFGIPACSLVTLPLNTRLSKDELLGIVTNARASALIYSPPFAQTAEAMVPDLPFLKAHLCTESGAGGCDLRLLMEKAGHTALRRPAPEDLATLLYTSGTTGVPKGVKLTHGNTTSTLASLLIEWGLTAEDSGLMVAPFFHVAGCHTYMSHIARGCTAHILPAFEPRATLDALEKTRATVTLLVPAMIGALLNLPDQEKADLSALKLIAYAGSPMPEELLKRALNRFGNVFFQIYGLTETSVLTCLTRKDHENPDLLTSGGREMYGCRVRIVDDMGRETAPDEIGHILASGDNVTSGYWEAPEETAAVLREGWFDTGDVAVRDRNGYIYLRDRKKDMIVTGGENVYPVEVENVLTELPEILEAAVIGVPDDRWGERVIALVHLRPEKTLPEEAILSYCRERLAKYKSPKAVVFMGPLPRTPSGKIQKNVLREPYWKGLIRRVN